MLFGKPGFPTKALIEELKKFGDAYEYSKKAIGFKTDNPLNVQKALNVIPSETNNKYSLKIATMDTAYRLRVIIDDSLKNPVEGDPKGLLERIKELIKAPIKKQNVNMDRKRLEVVYDADNVKFVHDIIGSLENEFPDRLYWADVELHYKVPEEKDVYLILERSVSGELTPIIPKGGMPPKKDESEESEKGEPSGKPKPSGEPKKPSGEKGKPGTKDTKELTPYKYVQRIDKIKQRIDRLKNRPQKDLRSLEKELATLLALQASKVAASYLKRIIES